MKRFICFLSLTCSLFCFLFPLTAAAQNDAAPSGSEVIYPTSFSITKPLSELIREHPYIDPADMPVKVSTDRSNRPHQTFIYSSADGPEFGNDPDIIQTRMGTRNNSTRATLQNWAGVTSSAFPPDPTGAVGPNHYVQAVNATTVRIWNKTGTQLASFQLGTLWGLSTNAGDPIILYDQYADRWFLSQFGTSTDKKIYIAISQTSDPTGAYYTYTFTSAQFPDYLKFSIWENGYYMTSNQSTDRVYCFERDQMLIGNASARAVTATFTTGSVSAFFVPLPADASDGSLPAAGTPLPFFAYYDNAWGGGTDGIKIWNMTVNWGTTPTATITAATQVNTSAFDASYDASWNDIPQPNGQYLDGIGGVLTYRVPWRSWGTYNCVVMNWGVLISSSPRQRAIYWCELRQNPSTGTWSLYQEGLYNPDAASRWMGSIAMDDNGSIALCYAKSSTSIYPGLYYTGRLAGDPLGTMTFAETQAVAGTGSQSTYNRFGDYSHTSLDPDGVTFWHTGEYVLSASNQESRVYSFQLPAGPLAPVAGFIADATAPVCSATVQFTDQSANTPTSWLWDFGDGTTSTLQNPSHTYATNGTFTVTLTATNATGSDSEIKTSYVTISMPAAPATIGNSRCGAGTLSLSATGTNTLYWWDAATGGNYLATGTSYTTPSLSATTTYYVENITLDASQNVGPTVGGSSSNNSSYLIFDVYETMKLVSVDARAGTAGTKTITLQNSAGTTIYTTTATVNTSSTTITLNWVIPAGTNYRLVTNANSALYRRTTSVAYPYTLAGVCSITGCSSGSGTYASWFNWAVQGMSCASSRVPCVATINSTVTPAVAVNASATTICPGTSVTFTATPTNGGTPTYQWQLNGTNVGSNSATYANAALAQNDEVTCTMTSTASCASPASVTSTPLTITVNPAVTPAVAISATATTICTGASVTFTATPTNGGTPSYQWKKNGSAIGSNSATFTSSALANNDVITCVMTSTANCASPTTATSNQITITVTSTVAPTLSIAATATTICSGTPVTFSATPSNGGTPTYQWMLNGSDVGTNSPFYSNSGLLNGDVVSCEITSSLACASPATAVSNSIPVTVTSLVTPAVAINASSSTICSGTSVTFTATPTNGGTPGYQWLLNGSPTGTNSPTYSSTTLANGDIVKCIMASSLSCASPASDTSNAITMAVTATIAPAVTINATATSICSGNNVTFTATPTNGGTPNYQWTINGSSTGTNSPTLSTTGLSNNDVVSCIMTSSLGCASPTSATATPITITVNPSVATSVVIGASGTNLCTGTPVTFNATAINGGSATYQWLLNGNPVGTNAALYTNAAPVNGDVISCQMTSSLACANPATATSNGISMIVKPILTPSVIVASSPAGPVCPGTLKTFTPVPTNGGNNPSYTWTVDGVNVASGPGYSGVFTNGQIISCTMTSNADCVNPLTASAMPITLSVYTVTPVTITESAGMLTSSAASGNQWYEQTSGMIPGAVFQNYSPSVNGNYYTVVTDNNGCEDTSNVINMLTVSVQENQGPALVTFFPNPTKGAVELTFGKAISGGRLIIENAIGQKIYEENITQAAQSKKTLDFSPYAAGAYFVIIRDAQNEFREKVIVEK